MSTHFDEDQHRRDSGGRFAPGDSSRAEAGQVELDPVPNLEEHHREISAIVDEFYSRGLLHEGNLRGRSETGMVELGVNEQGHTVYATMAVTHHHPGVEEQPLTTTDLEEVPEGYGLDISFWRQSRSRLREPRHIGRDVSPGIVSVVPEALMRVRDNHMNATREGTDAQMQQFDDIKLTSRDGQEAWERASEEIEDDNGHRFGSKWLYRPVSPSVYRDGLEAMAKAKEENL